ncbi:MAG: hypothetical protein A2992_06205 [Elusimicrobia bacterium RIFCSPLOWO2_01_FULL_59_12]|nr:MAG: hypothetical protein A2992_06205 [Elusimicrobia bacterium RIFCSPLOWO2_01_FULL_59_12]
MIRKERRRALRTHSSVPLDLYDPRSHVLIGEGRFVNVSLTGSLLESRLPLALRQSIHLQVQAPGKSPFEFSGRVVWRKKRASLFSYGIQFKAFPRTQTLSHVSAYKEVA